MASQLIVVAKQNLMYAGMWDRESRFWLTLNMIYDHYSIIILIHQKIKDNGIFIETK